MVCVMRFFVRKRAGSHGGDVFCRDEGEFSAVGGRHAFALRLDRMLKKDATRRNKYRNEQLAPTHSSMLIKKTYHIFLFGEVLCAHSLS